MGHLKAVVYVRPTQATLDLLCQMLRAPVYKEYNLFFTNIVPEPSLKALAEADQFELVRQVKVNKLRICKKAMILLGDFW